MRPRCPLAVWAVTPAVSASSDAVWARPSINSDNMAARAGSPIRAATSDKAVTVIMAIYRRQKGDPKTHLTLRSALRDAARCAAPQDEVILGSTSLKVTAEDGRLPRSILRPLPKDQLSSSAARESQSS